MSRVLQSMQGNFNMRMHHNFAVPIFSINNCVYFVNFKTPPSWRCDK